MKCPLRGPFKRFPVSGGQITVLGILPPGKFLPERSTPVYSPKECSSSKIFRFVAHFARVRIEDSSRNRFALYYRHISRKAGQRCFHAYFSWGDYSGGETTRVVPSGGNFPGGIFRSPSIRITRTVFLGVVGGDLIFFQYI